MPRRLRTCYRTQDGLADFFFNFEEQAGGDRKISTEDQPPYFYR